MPYENVNRTTDRNKSDNRQEISCPVHSHYVALLFVGLRSCHSGCAQQALPECAAHQYYSFRPYSGYHLSGLFPDGNTCWLLYQPVWLSPWSSLRSAPLWYWRLALYPGCCGGQFLCIPLCLFIIGCGLVFLETAANPYVTELGAKDTATSRLNLSQSFNGLGGIFATLCIGQFLFNQTEEGGNVVVPYTILGILVLVIALVFSRVDLPEISHVATAEDEAAGSNISKLFSHHKMFVFGLLALLSYEVAEISINSYFINFVTGMKWMDDRTASVALTCALAFFMVGRFLGSWIMRRIKATTMLLICAVGCVVCILLVLSNLGKLSLVALLCNYMFEAIMFPTIFSIALTGLGNLTKTASSLLMMTPIGGCGFLLMGLIADRTHFTLPFLVPLVGFVIVLAYAAREYKLAKK